MKREDLADRFVELQELVDVARETWLSGDKQSAATLMRKAQREIGIIYRRINPNWCAEALR